jgi:hypothetical protein
MDPAPAPYMIRINGHLGATVLSAFPALAPQNRVTAAHSDCHYRRRTRAERSHTIGGQKTVGDVEAGIGRR